ncbi:glycoside hydrolase family 3 C-terminal domain-containing protein [Amycolatopsis mongoliensis]|uniref:Glycoside hydrolase family 3 C-terminal domain-containing protein n=1 Tax=Amycolatopsis mongoliensis TaxID=715475 RepID=A0A9Y2NIQ1_9PSEU|nr:glycoside hydrolase family 3 C-terminal domain-containing protein [Amycolatopsis sp. 4-36]WIY00993.1 glycoside hydrolase family 3 C-terminal domain-containing protein [Amycolatopsis sp. 4-36]
MTDGKARLTAGADYWSTHPVPGHGPVRFADGPHGLRVQDDDNPDHLGIGRSAPATCFPPAVTLASSWDVDLVREVGAALGREARTHGVHVVLGPGLNIKRSPLCGRNFEYYSEDPLLSGLLAGAMVEGLQSQGVGACVKHFAANNQETDRMRVSADIDARPLREIYLRGFEIAIREANPWCVMSSYNRINGTTASENSWLLTDVLREEWGFDGVVVSDWGAVRDPVAALQAGLDLKMPGQENGPRVHDGDVDEQVLDRTLERLTLLARRTRAEKAAANPEEHHELTRRTAAESAVLLKNDTGLLPLSPSRRVAIIGELARTPRYQGAGSSRVNPTTVVSALDAAGRRLPGHAFAPGYRIDGEPDAALLEEATRVAAEADIAVLFLGLPDSHEAEGADRTHIDLPADQLALIDAIAQVNQRIVVALSNGATVTTAPWRDQVTAIVEFWLTGQAGGDSTLDVLLGEVTPSGKLTETIPLRLEDTPAFLDFPGENGHVRYSEGIHVGYRYYDTRKIDVDFPFGHGLSYTEFRYDDLAVTVHDLADPVAMTVSSELANTGDRTGAEVIQVYIGDRTGLVVTPEQELRAFTKVWLAPGEARRVSIPVRREHLEHYVPGTGWAFPGGPVEVRVGSSSRDIRLSTLVTLPGHPVEKQLTAWSTLGEWSDHPRLGTALWELLEERGGARGRMGDLLSDEAGRRAVLGSPLKGLLEFPGIPLDDADVEALLAKHCT